MTGTRVAYASIAAAAGVASFRSSVLFARVQGADGVHQFAIPWCLEVLALAAVWEHIRRPRDRASLVVFWSAFAAALAINVAHGAPDVVLMGLYAIPPLAVVGAGHMFLRTLHVDRKSARPKSRRTRRTAHPGTPVRTPAATNADQNGTPVRTRRVTAAELDRLVPTLDAARELRVEHGTWKAAWASVGATLSQGNKHRARLEHRDQ